MPSVEHKQVKEHEYHELAVHIQTSGIAIVCLDCMESTRFVNFSKKQVFVREDVTQFIEIEKETY